MIGASVISFRKYRNLNLGYFNWAIKYLVLEKSVPPRLVVQSYQGWLFCKRWKNPWWMFLTLRKTEWLLHGGSLENWWNPSVHSVCPNFANGIKQGMGGLLPREGAGLAAFFLRSTTLLRVMNAGKLSSAMPHKILWRTYGPQIANLPYKTQLVPHGGLDICC